MMWNPASKDSDYDGTYLGYIEKLEECKAINRYQRTIHNRLNKWVLEEGETLLYWMELPPVPSIYAKWEKLNQGEKQERSVSSKAQ